jgi:hypothetical protein
MLNKFKVLVFNFIFSSIFIIYGQNSDDVLLDELVYYEIDSQNIVSVELAGRGWLLSDCCSNDKRIKVEIIGRFEDSLSTGFKIRTSEVDEFVLSFVRQDFSSGEFVYRYLYSDMLKDSVVPDVEVDSMVLVLEDESSVGQDEESDNESSSSEVLAGAAYYLGLYENGDLEVYDDGGVIYFSIAEYFREQNNLQAVRNAIFWYLEVVKNYPLSDLSEIAGKKAANLKDIYIVIK